MRLAMGDDAALPVDASGGEKRFEVRAQAQRAVVVLEQLPVGVYRAGHVARPGGAAAETCKLFRRAHVPDERIGIVDCGQHVFELCDGRWIHGHRHLGCIRLRTRAGGERASFGMPGVQPAVQVAPVRMPDHVECPREPACPATALVVVEHEPGIRREAEATE